MFHHYLAGGLDKQFPWIFIGMAWICTLILVDSCSLFHHFQADFWKKFLSNIILVFRKLRKLWCTVRGWPLMFWEEPWRKGGNKFWGKRIAPRYSMQILPNCLDLHPFGSQWSPSICDAPCYEVFDSLRKLSLKLVEILWFPINCITHCRYRNIMLF